MSTPELTTYVQTNLQSGLDVDTIAAQLRTAGWPETDIQAAFKGAQQQLTPTTPLPSASPLPAPLQQSRMKTGWQLFKQSLGIIKSNPGLSRYAIVSTLWAIALFVIVVTAFIVDYLNGQLLSIDSIDAEGSASVSPTPVGYGILVIWGLIQTVITFFYATGLSSHVLAIFRAQQTSYAQNIAIARKKIGPIVVFSLINLIVGYILATLQRIRFVGWIISKFLSVVWTLATAFSIPLIADKDINGVAAAKESILLFKQNWGETITARVSLGGFLFLMYILISIPLTIAVTIGLGFVIGPLSVFVALALFLISLVIISILQVLATNVLNVALYYYATYKVVPPNFSGELLASVFTAKRKK